MAESDLVPMQFRAKGKPTVNVRNVDSGKKRAVIYFVQAETGPIKIGSTSYLASRMVTLRGQSPVALTLLATMEGDRTAEFRLHARFAAHRLHGEWFAPHPDILAEIERHGSPNG